MSESQRISSNQNFVPPPNPKSPGKLGFQEIAPRRVKGHAHEQAEHDDREADEENDRAAFIARETLEEVAAGRSCVPERVRPIPACRAC